MSTTKVKDEPNSLHKKLGVSKHIANREPKIPLDEQEDIDEEFEREEDPEYLLETLLTAHDTSKKANFRVQNRLFYLVYKYRGGTAYFDKQDVMDHMTKLGKVQELYVLPSNSDTNKATVVFVNFKTAYSTRKKDVFDIEFEGDTLRPIIKTIRSQQDGKKIRQILYTYVNNENNIVDDYIDIDLLETRDGIEAKSKQKEKSKKKSKSKDDEEDDGISPFEKVISCSSLQEALKKYGKFNTANGIVTMWNNRHTPKPERTTEEEALYDPAVQLKYRYHQELWDMLTSEKWDYRRLHWVVDPIGGRGKSTFVRCFSDKYGAICLKTASGSKDIAKLLQKQLEKGSKLEYIIIDLPRAAAQHKMWDTIECMLDGVFTALKYEGEVLQLTKRPRIIVFSNADPPFHPLTDKVKTQEAGKTVFVRAPKGSVRKWVTEEGDSCGISDDRWRIFDLVEGTKMCHIKSDDKLVLKKKKSIWLSERENPYYDPNFNKNNQEDDQLYFRLPGQEKGQPASYGGFMADL